MAMGKVILLGEHAVVYGHPALAGGISRGVTTIDQVVEKNSKKTSRLRIPDWDLDISSDIQHPVALAFAAMLEAAHVGFADLQLRSDLPAGAGLGSSAAMCVAIARCICDDDDDGEQVLAVANAGEACFHDTPSGIDVALSMSGGIARYQKDSGLTTLACPALPIVVGLSGIPRSTAKMVTLVRDTLREDSALESAISEIANLTREGQSALLSGNLEQLGSCMNRCHHELSRLGVGVATLDTMVGIAQSAGAVGAKLTGAGGGGAIIALAPRREHEVCSALREAGFESFSTELGSQN